MGERQLYLQWVTILDEPKGTPWAVDANSPVERECSGKLARVRDCQVGEFVLVAGRARERCRVLVEDCHTMRIVARGPGLTRSDAIDLVRGLLARESGRLSLEEESA